MDKLGIMKKIQHELGGSNFYKTKGGNYKIKDIFGKVHYYKEKQFNKMYETAKEYNFYGAEIK